KETVVEEVENLIEESVETEQVQETETEVKNETPETEKTEAEKVDIQPVEANDTEIENIEKTEDSEKEITAEITAPIVTSTKKVQKVEIEEELKEETKADQQKDKKERTDYSKYNQVELINALRELIDNADENDIKSEIEVIKSIFYKQKNEKIEQARAEFIEAGGMEEEFVAEEDPYENDIREQLKRFGQLKKELNKQLDSEKEENLARKFEIIEKIKGLINNE